MQTYIEHSDNQNILRNRWIYKSYRNVRYSTGYFEAPAIKISYVTVISGLMTKVILSRNSVQMKKYIYGVGVK